MSGGGVFRCSQDSGYCLISLFPRWDHGQDAAAVVSGSEDREGGWEEEEAEDLEDSVEDRLGVVVEEGNGDDEEGEGRKGRKGKTILPFLPFLPFLTDFLHRSV